MLASTTTAGLLAVNTRAALALSLLLFTARIFGLLAARLLLLDLGVFGLLLLLLLQLQSGDLFRKRISIVGLDLAVNFHGLVKLLLELLGVVAVGESNSQGFGTGLTFTVISNSLVDPGLVTSHASLQFHPLDNKVISTDLVGLLASHQDTDLAGLEILQKLQITSTTLLPFTAILVESVHLGTTKLKKNQYQHSY